MRHNKAKAAKGIGIGGTGGRHNGNGYVKSRVMGITIFLVNVAAALL